MNKKEFVTEVYSKCGLTKKDCELCLDVILDVIKSALSSGESVTLTNFGKFKITKTKAKSMYNFKEKKPTMVQAKKMPIFRASENLKRIVK